MDANMLNEAVSLLRRRKNMELMNLECTVEREATHGYSPTLGIWIRSADYKLSATVAGDGEEVDVEWLIRDRDLEDGAEVDAVVGRIGGLPEETRKVLRLAYMLFDGVRYATKGVQDMRFRPRVVHISKRFRP